MTDLANKKQALRIEWEKLVESKPDQFDLEEAILEFGERCFDLGVKAKGLLTVGKSVDE